MSDSYLLFLWSTAGYTLREVQGVMPAVGDELDHGGTTIVISKIGASPLPNDTRRCAFSFGKT